jgi:phosphate transport system permease protein
VYEAIERATEGIPVLGTLLSGSAGGRGFFTAGLVLSLMVTPVVTSVSREVLATVAPGQKEAAYGLGATRWEMIRTAMLPVSLGGLTAASMLGLGRALGETIAAALVIGSSAQITAQLFAPGDSMAAVVANQFGEASGTFRSALIGLGFLLFIITVVVNTLARTIVRWAQARSAGAA